MRRIGSVTFILFLVLLNIGALTIKEVLANQPNIVLNRAFHFYAPDGIPITLGPGKYFVEPAGGSELRLTREGKSTEFILQAEPLTHEQYELFSPMALTRPAQNHQFFITLFLPGGQKLESKGSTQPLPSSSPPRAVTSTPSPQTTGEPPSPIIETPPAPVAAVTPNPEPPLELQSQPTSQSLMYQAPTTDPLLQATMKLTPTEGVRHIMVYAPNHLGHTIHEQPRLFWHLSKATNHPIEVMLTEQGEVEVVFDMQLLPPLEPGMHHISLKDYGIRLLQDVPYQWKVQIVSGAPQGTVVASGLIKRVSPDAIPSGVNIARPQPDTPQLYASSGLWYDAFWALSQLLQTDPHNTTFLEQRAMLLDQVGLSNLTNLEPVE